MALSGRATIIWAARLDAAGRQVTLGPAETRSPVTGAPDTTSTMPPAWESTTMSQNRAWARAGPARGQRPGQGEQGAARQSFHRHAGLFISITVSITGAPSLRGAISNFENSKPGATVQPTRVQFPRLRALCQSPAGTTAWGVCPAARSVPRTTEPPPRPRGVRCQAEAVAPAWEMPDLDGVGHPMPVRSLSGRQQIVDGGGGGAAVRSRSIPESLAKPAAFRMRRSAAAARRPLRR